MSNCAKSCPAAPPAKAAVVHCVKCGESSRVSAIAVDVDTGVIHCGSCDESYTTADVREILVGWGRLLEWIDARESFLADAVPTPAPDHAAGG